jgi:hypothetical protein
MPAESLGSLTLVVDPIAIRVDHRVVAIAVAASALLTMRLVERRRCQMGPPGLDGCLRPVPAMLGPQPAGKL